jgi:hypothetical protein
MTVNEIEGWQKRLWSFIYAILSVVLHGKGGKLQLPRFARDDKVFDRSGAIWK